MVARICKPGRDDASPEQSIDTDIGLDAAETSPRVHPQVGVVVRPDLTPVRAANEITLRDVYHGAMRETESGGGHPPAQGSGAGLEKNAGAGESRVAGANGTTGLVEFQRGTSRDLIRGALAGPHLDELARVDHRGAGVSATLGQSIDPAIVDQTAGAGNQPSKGDGGGRRTGKSQARAVDRHGARAGDVLSRRVQGARGGSEDRDVISQSERARTDRRQRPALKLKGATPRY